MYEANSSQINALHGRNALSAANFRNFVSFQSFQGSDTYHNTNLHRKGELPARAKSLERKLKEKQNTHAERSPPNTMVSCIITRKQKKNNTFLTRERTNALAQFAKFQAFGSLTPHGKQVEGR